MGLTDLILLCPRRSPCRFHEPNLTRTTNDGPHSPHVPHSGTSDLPGLVEELDLPPEWAASTFLGLQAVGESALNDGMKGMEDLSMGVDDHYVDDFNSLLDQMQSQMHQKPHSREETYMHAHIMPLSDEVSGKQKKARTSSKSRGRGSGSRKTAADASSTDEVGPSRPPGRPRASSPSTAEEGSSSAKEPPRKKRGRPPSKNRGKDKGNDKGKDKGKDKDKDNDNDNGKEKSRVAKRKSRASNSNNDESTDNLGQSSVKVPKVDGPDEKQKAKEAKEAKEKEKEERQKQRQKERLTGAWKKSSEACCTKGPLPYHLDLKYRSKMKSLIALLRGQEPQTGQYSHALERLTTAMY